ncbi:MAG: carboxypeptidase regulatory-like domain-containing protein, partial [Phaeodactylibacter sp.]|nr:carboxypeptidase regulatory-like domain-containing protein [Phaeodactylibacter sp.]
MRLYFYLLFCLVFFVSFTVVAQNLSHPVVFGKVVEQSTEAPMEFVDVTLLEAASATFVQGTTTNGAGEFTFSDVTAGQYFLRFNFIGFENKETTPFSITGKGPGLNLDKIAIKVSSNLLDEVEVTAEKSTYNLSLDRKVYNVQKDIQSQTSSAAEILQNIPSITVDVNGQVSLRGTSNITYFINGRPSALLRASGSAALQQ